MLPDKGTRCSVTFLLNCRRYSLSLSQSVCAHSIVNNPKEVKGVEGVKTVQGLKEIKQLKKLNYLNHFNYFNYLNPLN
jgi:hypothetical protein